MEITELIYDAKTGVAEYKTRELTQEEIDEQTRERIESENRDRIAEIKAELTNLSQDFIQAELGAVFDDLDTRKERFRTLHNELRELLGKSPREYLTNVEESGNIINEGD